MTSPPQPDPVYAGGCFIAALVPIGAVAGGLMGQPSIGLLAGLGLGCAIAVALWLRTRGH
ncbi:MAG: hypothetical protein KA533_04770 [Sphingobium sp.]|nr:hypothetical protein [Sphingobium sp.]MBP6111769.1 hypothetical protein [Sphingobium sp.]MBP8671259.1 hypothetical protein [Sphingobium sp.]MBP9156324.1 hypothetical protein [Sphingobium sp.]